MKILFLTDNFPPEVNAPASRTYEHCREWVRLGHQVTVITCVPNFPVGKIFSGYENNIVQTKSMEGVRVIRVWSYIAQNQGFSRRILDYLSYMFAAVLVSAKVRSVDVVIGTSPQFFTAVAAWYVGKIRHIPYIFELRDIWPESIRAVEAVKSQWIFSILEGLELFLYRQAAKIISVTHSFRQNLISRNIQPRKISVVLNGFDRSRFTSMGKDDQLLSEYGGNDQIILGYIGTHGMAHTLETILYAAEKLQNGRKDHKFLFLMIGDGAQRSSLEKLARDLRLKNIRFVGLVPKEEIPRYWSILDFSIIHLKKTALFTTVIPSKLFESIGMGVPVLHGVEGESAEIVEKEGVGLTFEPENVDQLVARINEIIANPDLSVRLRHNCLLTAPRYDRQIMAKKMLQIIQTVVDYHRG